MKRISGGAQCLINTEFTWKRAAVFSLWRGGCAVARRAARPVPRASSIAADESASWLENTRDWRAGESGVRLLCRPRVRLPVERWNPGPLLLFWLTPSFLLRRTTPLRRVEQSGNQTPAPFRINEMLGGRVWHLGDSWVPGCTNLPPRAPDRGPPGNCSPRWRLGMQSADSSEPSARSLSR
jgi:hypothetical protein